jgi:hypothetical protein
MNSYVAHIAGFWIVATPNLVGIGVKGLKS